MHERAEFWAVGVWLLWPAVAAAQAPDTAVVRAGREVFVGAGNCYVCHGRDAKGTALAPDLTDTLWLNVDGRYESIVRVVESGIAEPKEHPTPMPPFGGAKLTAEQARAVAAYVWSLTAREK